MSDLPDFMKKCPHCGNDLTQGEGSRLIGIYSRERDRTVAWKCPDCKKEWPR